jgi:hypothetical protein
MKKFLKNKFIEPEIKKAESEVYKKVEKEFKSIIKKTIVEYIIILALLVLFSFFLPKKIALFLSSIVLWGVIFQGVYGVIKNRNFIYLLIKARGNTIYQYLFEEIKKEVKKNINNKSQLEQIFLKYFIGETENTLTFKITNKAHEYSTKIILSAIVALIVVIVTYFFIRNYIIDIKYNLDVMDILLFKSI